VKTAIRKFTYLQAILQHHEKWMEAAIPTTCDLSARSQYWIIDAYDALNQRITPYPPAAKPLEALRIIKNDVKNENSIRIFELFAIV
jgi:HD-GYP domain-containing protein (c-di-GMP phosphodiesterase class II)